MALCFSRWEERKSSNRCCAKLARGSKSPSLSKWAAPSPSTPSEEEVEDDDGVPDLMTDVEEILDPLQLNQNGKVRGGSKRSQERKKAKERKKAAIQKRNRFNQEEVSGTTSVVKTAKRRSFTKKVTTFLTTIWMTTSRCFSQQGIFPPGSCLKVSTDVIVQKTQNMAVQCK